MRPEQPMPDTRKSIVVYRYNGAGKMYLCSDNTLSSDPARAAHHWESQFGPELCGFWWRCSGGILSYDYVISLPLSAEEYSCHAPTTIFDQTGRAIAECSGLGNPTDESVQHAAFIVQSANECIALLAVAQAAKPVADRFAAVMREADFSGHVTVEECTLPDDSITLTLTRREWESLYNAMCEADQVKNH